MKYGMLVEYISVPRKKLFSQKKKLRINQTKCSVSKGLAREIHCQLLEEKQNYAPVS